MKINTKGINTKIIKDGDMSGAKVEVFNGSVFVVHKTGDGDDAVKNITRLESANVLKTNNKKASDR